MARRSKKAQSAHDSKVRGIANKLRRQGCSVRADMRGFKRPKPIGKNRRIPDIVAKCGRRTKIIEVETPRTVKTDRKQHSTFRRSAAQKKGSTFDIIIARKR